MVADLLRLEAVTAGYGDAVVLESVSLALAEGGSLALLGRNGVGKTTLLLTIMGLARLHGGRLWWRGPGAPGGRELDLGKLPPHRRARAGLGWVPQERRVFPSLTVDEHLTATARPGHWTPERVYQLLPRLAERRHNRGGQLSGGEQQMLSLGRALMLNPRLLLLDEPMEGLAPMLVQEVARGIRRIVEESGVALLLVEQHVRLALSLTARAVVLDRGRIVHEGESAALAADPEALARLIGVASLGGVAPLGGP
jgi:branched-chain amino acid transport system ATP-binding protein